MRMVAYSATFKRNVNLLIASIWLLFGVIQGLYNEGTWRLAIIFWGVLAMYYLANDYYLGKHEILRIEGDIISKYSMIAKLRRIAIGTLTSAKRIDSCYELRAKGQKMSIELADFHKQSLSCVEPFFQNLAEEFKDK